MSSSSNSRSTLNTPTMSKNQSMSASPIVVAPSPSSANTPSKPFDDSCFKTPLPPTNKKGRPPRSRVNHGNRSNGHQHESPAPKSTGRGSRGGRGGRAAAAVSKGPQRGGRARIVPQKPPPPPKKFTLHDMFCPKTSVFLKKFKLPKIASLPPERRPRLKEEPRFVKQEPAEDQPSCSTAIVKTEAPDVKPDVSSNQPGTSKIISPNKEVKTEPLQQRPRPRLARRMFPPGEKKLPFVEELIIDEFSLLTFTCREDERLFALEVRRRKAIYDAKRKKFQLERIRKINRIKRRVRRKKKAIERQNRAGRKRSRALKRDRLRRARKEKHAALKKAVREAKANGTLTSELKKLWKAEKEKCDARREELRKRKVEHEVRKEARRVKREKEYRKKGKKRRGRRAAKKAKERKLKEKQPKTARGRKMKDPGPALVEPAGAATLKRPSSKTPSPIPHKTSRIDDPYRNGIIGIAKSDSSASTPLPIVATPPGLLPPRTPLSVESKPHTTSSESAHPSDPGHRAPSAAPLVPQGHPGSSLFVNTSSSANSLLTPANPMNPLHALDPMRLAAAAAGNPFLAGAGVNIPFLQMLQQQQLQLGNNPSAAAALLQAAGAHGAAGAGLPFPPQLHNQLAASAALLGRSLPAPTLKKPGRWCGMHVKIAQEVQAARKMQDARNVEAARQPPQQAQDPALLAQQQALAAAAAQHHQQQQQRQPPQPPHCLPSTSCAPPPGLAGLSSLQQQQALAGMNPQMLNALHQEAARIAAATPKPPTAGMPPGMTPQRPPSTMPPRQPGLQLGQMGIPGLASLAAGLPLAPPSSTAGSLTNGQSEQAALLQLMMQAQQQQQQAQAAQQHQQGQQPPQHPLLAQREQQAAVLQQQQAAAAAHAHQQHPGIPVSTAGLLAQQHLLQQQQQHQQQQQQQQQAAQQAQLRLTDPAQQLLQLQMLQQLDPRTAALIAQHHAQQQQQQQQQQQGAAPTTTATPGAPQTQLDLLRAHMEQQQQQQQILLAAQQQAAAAAQQQGQPTSTATQDPREVLMRQMMLGQQAGRQPLEAFLAAQQAAAARMPQGIPGLSTGVPTSQPQPPQVSQPPSSVAASQAQLFNPGMMGLQLPTTFKQMPYASQLQAFSQQMKQEAPTSTAPAIPNGR